MTGTVIPHPSAEVPDLSPVEQLSARQLRAALALAGGATIADAARRSFIGERTLRRWLAGHGPGPERFQAALRQLRDEQLGDGRARLAHLCGLALDTLERTLAKGSKAPVSVKARVALAVLDRALGIGARVSEAEEPEPFPDVSTLTEEELLAERDRLERRLGYAPRRPRRR